MSSGSAVRSPAPSPTSSPASGSSGKVVERIPKLKSEFVKEDPSFLDDLIYVPDKFPEVLDDFVYNVLLHKPPNDALSITRFGRDHFRDLLQRVEEEDPAGYVAGPPRHPEYVIAELAGDDLAYKVEDVIVPDCFHEVVAGFVHDVLEKQPEGGVASLILFGALYFQTTYLAMDGASLQEIEVDEEEEEGEDEGPEIYSLPDDYVGAAERLLPEPEEPVEDKEEGEAPAEEETPSGEGESQETEQSEDNQNENREILILPILENTSFDSNVNENQEVPDTTQRRGGISSEPFDPRASTHRPTKVSKPDHLMAKLKDEAANILALRNLDDKTLQTALEALTPRLVKAGELVTSEGAEDDDLYIVETGDFNVYKKEDENDKTIGLLINSLKDSGSFGEIALMYQCPRKATVKAMTDGKLWKLDRKTYQHISSSAAFQERLLIEQTIGKLEMLKTLKQQEVASICDAVNVRDYPPGSVIIAEGDQADSMFFLLEGEVEVSVSDSFGVPQPVRNLTDGSYFGEMALITMEKRKASVTAVKSTRCGELGVDAFERLLGPCKEIMRRNQSVYKAQVERLSMRPSTVEKIPFSTNTAPSYANQTTLDVSSSAAKQYPANDLKLSAAPTKPNSTSTSAVNSAVTSAVEKPNSTANKSPSATDKSKSANRK